VFPARYELNSYIVFRKRLVSKRLIPSPGVEEFHYSFDNKLCRIQHQSTPSEKEKHFLSLSRTEFLVCILTVWAFDYRNEIDSTIQNMNVFQGS
jgi:hypothetical protein